MSADDENFHSFEETVRAIAREVSQAAERMAQIDLDEIATSVGIDPDRAREWMDTASRWVRDQAGTFGEEVPFGRPEPTPEPDFRADTEPAPTPFEEEALRSAAPHPLDLPTEEQGRALAALDSGRWTVEPGSNTLSGHGEGPRPSDEPGLVRELHVRDWIGADGTVTRVGRHALSRWLETAESR
jgi:hypothetical protein